jgi:hypothetical protein
MSPKGDKNELNIGKRLVVSKKLSGLEIEDRLHLHNIVEQQIDR